ncbi:MAG: VWA domain-containing protein [Thermoproteus sp.]
MSAPFQLEAYLNRDNLPAGSEVEVFLMVRARPTKEAAAAVQTYRRKVHMAFVIDASGSMCGEKLETAKEAIIRRYQIDLDDDDMLSLITFSDHAKIVVDSATKKSAKNVEATIRGAQCEALTNLYEGIERAVDVLSKTPTGYLRVMVIATDGIPTVGVTDPAKIVGLVQEARQRHNITTFVYGIGDDYDLKLCDDMAKAGGGAMKHASKPDKLEGLTQALATMIKSTVAPKLALDLIPEAGVEIREAALLSPRAMVLDPRGKPWDVGMVAANDIIIATFKLKIGPKPEGQQKIAAVALGAVKKDVEAQFVKEAPFAEAHPEARIYHMAGVRVANIIEKSKKGVNPADEYRLLDSLLGTQEARDLVTRDPYFARLVNVTQGTRVEDAKTRVDRLTTPMK